MSDAKERSDKQPTGHKICPNCMGKPADTEENQCPVCKVELETPASLHQKYIAQSFEPEAPNRTTHTF